MTNESLKIKTFRKDADNGEDITTFTIDGIDVNPDALDGVVFIIGLSNGEVTVSVREVDQEYFSTLNEAKWLKEVKAHVLSYFTEDEPIYTLEGFLVKAVTDNAAPVSDATAALASKLKGFSFDDEDDVVDAAKVVNESETIVPNSRLAGILSGIEENDAVETEETKKEAAIQAYDLLPADQKINALYEQVIAHAKATDPDDIVITYLEDKYNPETTTLDKANLLFNLTLISRLQEFDLISFDFDEDVNNAKDSVTEYTLAHEFWAEIMKSGMDTESKYAKILDKNFRLLFYSALFREMANNSSKTAYNNNKRKLANLFTEETQTMEDGVIEYIKNKSVDGSMIMITPDLTPFFELDDVNTEKLTANDVEAQIKFLGKWNNRKVFEINTKNIKYLKGFERGAFFIQAGNTFRLNPKKPLGFFNVIDNPFLEKPSLKMYVNLDVKFHISSSTFLRIEDI
jgi:hypothetical protein